MDCAAEAYIGCRQLRAFIQSNKGDFFDEVWPLERLREIYSVSPPFDSLFSLMIASIVLTLLRVRNKFSLI
jgi:hypothetical protein